MVYILVKDAALDTIIANDYFLQYDIFEIRYHICLFTDTEPSISTFRSARSAFGKTSVCVKFIVVALRCIHVDGALFVSLIVAVVNFLLNDDPYGI